MRGSFGMRRAASLAGLWMFGAAAVSTAAAPADRPRHDQALPSQRLCQTLSPRQTRIRFRGKRFDIATSSDLRRLDAALEKETQVEPTRPSGKKGDGTGSSDRRELVEMRALAARALASGPDSCEALAGIAEIGDSLDLDRRVPVRRRLDVVQVPFYYIDMMHSPVAKGKEPAGNLAPTQGSRTDPSLLDPLPSTFWARPKDIASQDLYHAFGPILTIGREPCTYDEPKTSYGTTPGFSMKCGERIIKVKFGAVRFGVEEHARKDSEATATRLFGGLGFHVEPNDYAPEIRIRYDRRILLEFNARKKLTMTITALGFIPVTRVKVQSAEDPFRYIRAAVTKDGRVLSPDALAQALLRRDVLERSKRAASKHPKGTLPGHYREDAAAFERGLDHLVMQEANIQARESGGRNIGPWGWDRLDHTRRRELRGAGLLAAWINYFDARWDNNRLKFVEGDEVRGGGARLEHFVSDLGGALGRAENFRVAEGNLVNDFPWTFTERPFRIVGYKPVFDNGAFREMTRDDARWMARLIAQLTENQLKQSLIAGGFTSAEVKVYTEKLISRRDTMIADLGLAGEIALLRPKGIVRSFDYDPRKDGPMTATSADGSELRPIESQDQVVRGGRVEPRERKDTLE